MTVRQAQRASPSRTRRTSPNRTRRTSPSRTRRKNPTGARPHLVAIQGGRGRRTQRTRLRTKARAFQRFPAASVSAPGMRFVAAASAAVMALIFGLVMLHILSAQASFRLESLHERVAREEVRHRQMRYEIAAAESPGRVAEAARSLGLVQPAERRYIFGPGPELDSKEEASLAEGDGPEPHAAGEPELRPRDASKTALSREGAR